MSREGDTINTEEKPQLLADVVESMGMGWAQLLVLALGAGGIFLAEGILMTSVSTITLSVAHDLNLTNTERSMLSTMVFCGLALGIGTSGWIADLSGRRLVIVLSYTILAASLFLCSMLESWTAITIAGFGGGFGSGFGMPPSIAMLSEVSPVKWRMAMRGATACHYSVGMVYVLLMAAADDATLHHLHWRRLLFNAAMPIACYVVLSAACLPESPVLLASQGLKAQAESGFRTFARRNGNSISGAYELPETSAGETLSLRQQVAVIFAPKRRYVTFATTYACFTLNVAMFGGMYAGPLIFAETSTMPAAYQNLLTVIAPAATAVLAGIFSDNVSRKSCVLLALAALISCNAAICFGGAVTPPRSWALEALYQYGAEGGGCGVALGFAVLFQLAVEIYPPTTSATGGAFIMGIGRIGAIIAPKLFEFMRATFGVWQSFYVFVDVVMAICFAMWMFMPSRLSTDGKDDELAGSQLVLSARSGYSTINMPVKSV